ncbi:unnamed protein product [Closterium sp. NIES-65]|nr:unnamed protein product [Closterium sp. NIES-65]
MSQRRRRVIDTCRPSGPSLPPIPTSPVQVESYYVSGPRGRPYYHEIYYAAFFLADMAWPAGSAHGWRQHSACHTTRATAVAPPPDGGGLQRQGVAGRWAVEVFSPLSISLTENPIALTGFSPLSIALTEDPIALTRLCGGRVEQRPHPRWVSLTYEAPQKPSPWHTGVARTEEQLQQELAQLPHPLVPTYLKAYTVGLKRNTLFLPLHLFSLPPLSSSSPYQAGLLCVFYAYVARPPTSPTAPHRILTPDISRSGFELLALSLKHPPLLVASFLPPKFEGHGKVPGKGTLFCGRLMVWGGGLEERGV